MYVTAPHDLVYLVRIHSVLTVFFLEDFTQYSYNLYAALWNMYERKNPLYAVLVRPSRPHSFLAI